MEKGRSKNGGGGEGGNGSVRAFEKHLTANVRSMNLDRSEGSSRAAALLISSQIYKQMTQKTSHLHPACIYLSPCLLQNLSLVTSLEGLNRVQDSNGAGTGEGIGRMYRRSTLHHYDVCYIQLRLLTSRIHCIPRGDSLGGQERNLKHNRSTDMN